MSEYGKLHVDVGGSASGFQQVIRSVKRNMEELGKSWSVPSLVKGAIGGIAGALSFEAVKASFEGFLNRAAELKEISEQLEMSAEQTQKWQIAADKLGLSLGGIQNVMQIIQAKRLEAAKDKSAAGMFTDLGISRSAVLDTEGVDASSFAKRVMNAASKNPRAWTELVGRRFAKYSKVAGGFDSASAPMDDEALEIAHKAEQSKKSVMRVIDKGWSTGLVNVLDFSLSGLARKAAAAFLTPFGLSSFAFLRSHSGAAASGSGAAGSESPAAPGGQSMPYDPLSEAEATKHAKSMLELEERLEEARRRNMTHGERRNSLLKEEKDLQEKISYLTMLKEGHEASYEQEQELTKDQIKLEQLKTELRDKPPELSADALAKAGLFSGSALNTVVGPDETNAILRRIEHNTNQSKWSL